MRKLMTRFIQEESGATMVEYAILVALISIAAITTLLLIGPQIDDAFTEVNTALTPVP